MGIFKTVFWFLILAIDFICMVLFSIKIFTGFSLIAAFCLCCFIVSGILAFDICKTSLKNIKQISNRNKMGIVSIYQLKKTN